VTLGIPDRSFGSQAAAPHGVGFGRGVLVVDQIPRPAILGRLHDPAVVLADALRQVRGVSHVQAPCGLAAYHIYVEHNEKWCRSKTG
jgi:hypothetical protein